MKKIIVLLLCILLLAGCTVQMPVNTATEASEATEPAETETAPDAEEDAQEPSSGAFGLAYLPEYGLNPYDCMCLTNRPILSLLYEGLFAFHFHPLEKEMATHSSTLAWKIPWMEEPDRKSVV